jgi:hypothetical protein
MKQPGNAGKVAEAMFVQPEGGNNWRVVAFAVAWTGRKESAVIDPALKYSASIPLILR